jgi:CheY-like chemotaxis protein
MPTLVHMAVHELRTRPLVLHIDDNRDCRDLVSQILQLGGLYELASAEDGRRGLALAHKMKPNLILLDFRLPDMDGLDVLLHLQSNARTRDVPVVIVSAEAHRDIVARCLASGAKDYITKPFDLHHFVQVVADAAAAPMVAPAN